MDYLNTLRMVDVVILPKIVSYVIFIKLKKPELKVNYYFLLKILKTNVMIKQLKR